VTSRREPVASAALAITRERKVAVSSEPTRTGTALRDLVARSIELITDEQAPSGAYPACSTFPVYQYAWLRDGSFVAEAMSAHGDVASAEAFHGWAARVINDRAERIDELVADLDAGRTVANEQFLPTRYTLDGNEGTEGWWDFQLDGYGTWLWALVRHLDRHPADRTRYRRAVESTVRYLVAAWPRPCYDWWEEHAEHLHVSTLASIEAGLRAALRSELLSDDVTDRAERAVQTIAATIREDGCVDGRLRKWLGSTAIDASLLSAIAPFEVVDAAVALRTVAAVELELADDRGVHRFRDDVFYGGGRWPVLAGLLGQSYVRLGRTRDAASELEWIASTADVDGYLPEQVSDRLLAPAQLEYWVQRWGPVAQPLLWSHAAYLSLAGQLGITA
jgi:GH15 family glucan-1,4-alpha-glucosidase